MAGKKDTLSDDPSFLGKKTNPVPKPKQKIDVDTDSVFMDNIIAAGAAGKLDMGAIDSFSQISQRRDQMYTMLDTMAEDTTISSVLETYAEDATERNDKGDIVWVESADPNVAKYVTYLLSTMNVNKNIYKWVYSLCKYGDIYLRLYRQSEFDDVLFADQKRTPEQQHLQDAMDKQAENEEQRALNEDIVVKAFSNNDKYVHYLELVPNPAEMFELTKFGKTYAYIQSKVLNSQSRDTNTLLNAQFRYAFNRKDIDIYDATAFVHGSLEDNVSRVPEEVEIFMPQDNEDIYSAESSRKYNYQVKRGQSLLYNSYRLWRELSLLENSMLLNRITKSSILRIIGVEVGNMPKEQVGPHLMSVKNLVEQKASLDVGNSMTEYTNPGAIENNIYVPTHNNIGNITMQTIGGDVSVTGLEDIDYFKNKFFGGLRVPKQYFGFTDDAAGFSGGESLSLLSSRYAKMIKRIQNTTIQALTDAINLMLLDKGLDNYVNRFELQMLAPTTIEEKERRENTSTRISFVSDVMNLLQDVQDPGPKLKVLQTLLSGIIPDSDISEILEEEIKKAEELAAASMEAPQEESYDDAGYDVGGGPEGDFGGYEEIGNYEPAEPVAAPEQTQVAAPQASEPQTASTSSSEVILPTPSSLGRDFTDNNLQ